MLISVPGLRRDSGKEEGKDSPLRCLGPSKRADKTPARDGRQHPRCWVYIRQIDLQIEKAYRTSQHWRFEIIHGLMMIIPSGLPLGWAICPTSISSRDSGSSHDLTACMGSSPTTIQEAGHVDNMSRLLLSTTMVRTSLHRPLLNTCVDIGLRPYGPESTHDLVTP